MSSGRTDTAFVAADLRMGVAAIPSDLAPASLWLDLPGGVHPVPAWPLTPALHARLRAACVRLEDRWARGDYPQEKMEKVWQRWLAIDAWAQANLDGNELRLAMESPPMSKLPDLPPLHAVMTPFRDWPEPTHWPGASKASVREQRAKKRARRGKAKNRRKRSGQSWFG